MLSEAEIQALVEPPVGMTQEVVLKGNMELLFNALKNSLAGITSKDEIRREVMKFYADGIKEVASQVSINFQVDERKIDFLTNYVFDNIKGMTEEIAEDLRSELSRGIMNLESLSKIKERIKKIMDVGNTRVEMIARTEMNRALNMGSLDAAKSSEIIVEKEWLASGPRECELCHKLNGKRVGLNDYFKSGDWRGQSPPRHPNCMCTILYNQIPKSI